MKTAWMYPSRPSLKKGSMGDGRILVSPVQAARTIRSGEQGL